MGQVRSQAIEFGQDTLAYDLTTHQIHRLKPASATILALCDGNHTPTA